MLIIVIFIKILWDTLNQENLRLVINNKNEMTPQFNIHNNNVHTSIFYSLSEYIAFAFVEASLDIIMSFTMSKK